MTDGVTMQTSRLFEIVYILMDKKTLKADELAQHFEVSKRTILRDVDKLSMAGIPVYASPGRGGGISILDDYVLNKATLSDEEQEYILMALQNMTVTGNMDQQTTNKIKSFFGKEKTDWIEVDFSRWGNRESDTERFDILKNAILKRKAVAFTYIDPYGKETKRKVYPLKLVFKARSWYLQAYSIEREDYRTFKINRMIDIRTTDEGFERSDYRVPPIESEFKGNTKVVQLEFKPELAFRVYDEFDEGSIEKGDDGLMYVAVSLPEDEWLYSYLMSFGDKVTVISPKEVAETLRKKHEEAVSR